MKSSTYRFGMDDLIKYGPDRGISRPPRYGTSVVSFSGISKIHTVRVTVCVVIRTPLESRHETHGRSVAAVVKPTCWHNVINALQTFKEYSLTSKPFYSAAQPLIHRRMTLRRKSAIHSSSLGIPFSIDAYKQQADVFRAPHPRGQ